jgi:hypothetical protein
MTYESYIYSASLNRGSTNTTYPVSLRDSLCRPFMGESIPGLHKRLEIPAQRSGWEGVVGRPNAALSLSFVNLVMYWEGGGGQPPAGCRPCYTMKYFRHEAGVVVVLLTPTVSSVSFSLAQLLCDEVKNIT